MPIKKGAEALHESQSIGAFLSLPCIVRLIRLTLSRKCNRNQWGFSSISAVFSRDELAWRAGRLQRQAGHLQRGAEETGETVKVTAQAEIVR